MTPSFICHPDFAKVTPIQVFHKELCETPLPEHPSSLKNRHILYRGRCELRAYCRATLRITADDYYKLYINGRFVAQGPSTSYPSRYYYNELDVTDLLRQGENVIAVHTYYQGLINRAFVSGDLRHCLWASLSVDGETVLVSDTDWLTADHTAYTEMGRVGYDTAYLERYDAAAPEVGFAQPDFDDGAWRKAEIFASADYTLVPQPTPPLSVYSVPPLLTARYGNTVIADFGQEMVGYPEITVRASAGDALRYRVGEELNPDGTVRARMRCNCHYEEEMLLSGGLDILDHYDYTAFRYLELTLPEGAELLSLSMRVRHAPYVRRAEYDGDEAFLGIIRLCENTVKYGTQEVFVDCPTREKGQYLGDASIAGRAHATLTGDTTMLKKTIREFFETHHVCDGILAVSSGSLMQEIADYSLQLPAQVLWVYRTDGDSDFLREAEPYITALFRYFRRFMREDCLLESVTEKWNLVDWPENLRDGYDFPITKPIGPGLHNVINAFWCGALDATDEIYLALGMEATGITETAKASFLQTFYSEEIGLFCDTPQRTHAAIHSNVLPLLFGIGLAEKEGLAERIGAFIERKGLGSMGVYMAYFTLAALVKQGMTERAMRLTVAPDAWLNMLREGATTTYEAWGKDQKWNTSLFHPWATAPLIVFAKDAIPY